MDLNANSIFLEYPKILLSKYKVYFIHSGINNCYFKFSIFINFKAYFYFLKRFLNFYVLKSLLYKNKENFTKI